MTPKGWNTFTAPDWYGFTAEQWYGFRVSLYVEAFHVYAPEATTSAFQSETATHVHREPIATAVWSIGTNSMIYVPQSLMTMFVATDDGLLWTPHTTTEIFSLIEQHTHNPRAEQVVA